MTLQSDNKPSCKPPLQMRLQVIAEAPPAVATKTQRELHDEQVVANAIARIEEQAAKQAALDAAKISYTEFIRLAERQYVELNAAWYKAGGISVLPPERKICNVKHTQSRAIAQGYWHMPTLYVSQMLLIEEWCANVRWKILNGYGIEVVAWCKEAEPKDYLVVSYAPSGYYKKSGEQL